MVKHFANQARRSIFALSAVAVLALTARAADAESFLFVQPGPEEAPLHATALDFLAKLQELSGDGLDPQYHFGGDLGDWASVYEQIKQGAIQMGMTFGFSEYDPRLDIGFLAYVVEDWESGRELFGPGGPMAEVYQEILDGQNMQLLATLPSGGFYGISIRKGVGTVPDDLPAEAAGLKVRVPPMDIAVRRYGALGFSPTAISKGELYTALQLGTVDGRTMGTANEAWTERDVIETFVRTGEGFEQAIWVANLEWWSGLSEDQRADIMEAVNYATDRAWAAGEAQEQEDLARIKEAGIAVVDLTPEQLAAVKAAVIETEWAWMEGIIGKDFMDKVRAATGH